MSEVISSSADVYDSNIAFAENMSLTSPEDQSTAPINKTFVLSPTKQFSYEDRSVPELRTPRHVRVRVVATGLCGSDVCNVPCCCTVLTNVDGDTGTLLAAWTYRAIRR